jgi:hypothetical protein
MYKVYKVYYCLTTVYPWYIPKHKVYEFLIGLSALLYLKGCDWLNEVLGLFVAVYETYDHLTEVSRFV